VTTGDPSSTIEARFELRAHVRRRILPRLAELDGIASRIDEILALHDALMGDDLAFDLRTGPRFPSNLCAENANLEIGATFGRDRTGVRTQMEPVCRRGVLKNRYTLARDRMASTMRALDEGFDEARFRSLWSTFMGGRVRFAHGEDATATILAAHHYSEGPPRLKAYFGCDYVDDRAHGFEIARSAIASLDDGAALVAQVETLRAHFDDPVPRMVGFDFAPSAPVKAKMYVGSEGLSAEGLASLVRTVGGDARAEESVRAFLRSFVDDDGDDGVGALNLVCFALDARGPSLKLYARPVERMGDGETLARLAPWFASLDRAHELAHVSAALDAVCPSDVLAETRGAFNYVSVDVTTAGVDKTSVYFVPQIPLAHLARTAPDRLPPFDR